MRRLALFVGVALVASGLAVAFAPGLAGGLDPTPRILTAVAVVALLGGGSRDRNG